MLKKNDLILFQGDSITDCGRDRAAVNANDIHGLGRGYPVFITGSLMASQPKLNLSVLNRGISGNRIVDLYARWKSDGLNLKPTVISILIGVNDTWHEFGSNNGVETDRFATIYDLLLSWTRKAAPSTRLILCEPFVLKCGVVTPKWVPDMKKRRQIVAELAATYGATLVQFQAMFDQACKVAPAEYWAKDGVHPTPAGHALMAAEWLRATGQLD